MMKNQLFFGIFWVLFVNFYCANSTIEKLLIRELIPLEAPTNLTLLGFFNGEAKISWNPVKNESVRGTFKGYIIRIWNNGFSQVYAIPQNITETSIQFLPFSKNFLTVSVRNDKYVGPRSAAINFYAPQIVPDVPFMFEQYQLGSQSILLKWSKPRKINGILLGYNIYCSEISDSLFGINEKTTIHEFVQTSNMNQAKLTGLKLGQKYKIEISALNCAGEGKKNSLIIEITHHEAYSPTVPSFLYKINYKKLEKDAYFHKECTKTTTISNPHHPINSPPDYFYNEREKSSHNCSVNTLIRWIPNLKYNPGEYFYVKYRIKGDRAEADEWIETPIEKSEDFLIIHQFNACKNYEIILVVIDGDFKTESDVQETPAILFL